MSHIQCSICDRIWPEDYDANYCECGQPVDSYCSEVACATCHLPLSPAPGCEWPERQKLYCWGCAHERMEELEMSLRIIQTWAGCYDPMIETTEKALGDIRNKCIEALKRT